MSKFPNDMISDFENERKRLRLDERASNVGSTSSNAQRTCDQVPLVKQVLFDEGCQSSQQQCYFEEMEQSISLESSSIMSNKPRRQFARRNSQTAAMMEAAAMKASLNTHPYQRRNSVVEAMLYPMTKESVSMESWKPEFNGQDSISSLISESEKSRSSFITDEWKEEEQLRQRLKTSLGLGVEEQALSSSHPRSNWNGDMDIDEPVSKRRRTQQE
jgi:hypothetical protein